MKVKSYKKQCLSCNKHIISSWNHTKYCSKICKYKMYNKIRKHKLSHLAPSTIGTVQELLVSIDLLKKGFHVFRATSPSCPCDLIAMKTNMLYRIEVTTGQKQKNGSITYPPHDGNKYDVLAIVTDGSILYSFEKKVKEF